MPPELSNAAESLLAAIQQIPAAIIVILLLAGPTTAWIIYRSLVVPRRRRYAGHDDDLLWICEHCRSANEYRKTHCYQCGFDREQTTGDLHVVDGDGLVVLGSAGNVVASTTTASQSNGGPGIPVGPGQGYGADQPNELPALAPRPDVKRSRVPVTTSVVPAPDPVSAPEPDAVVVDKTA